MNVKAVTCYLAELKCLAVLPCHLPAVIFGMSYQTPVKFIVCPCKGVVTSNKTAHAFLSNLSDKDHFQMRDFGIVGACRGGIKGLTEWWRASPLPNCIIFFQSGFEILQQVFSVTYSTLMVTQEYNLQDQLYHNLLNDSQSAIRIHWSQVHFPHISRLIRFW